MIAALITKILFLIAVVDPIGSIPVYIEATKNLDKEHKRMAAIWGPVIAFGIFLFFIVVGQLILEGMAISLEAFQISGGVILFIFALSMIFGEGKPESEKHLITDYKHVTTFPIAMPSIASPGAIMAVVLLTDNHLYSISEQIVTTTLVIIVTAITILVLLLANKLHKLIGDYGIVVISKVMGLILASYGVQSVLSGLMHFFN